MDMLVGILAAWGLVMLLWTVAGLFLLPLSRREDLRMTVLVRGRNHPRCMERYLRGLVWLRNMGLLWWDVLVLEDGLTREEVDWLRCLMEKEPCVSFIRSEKLRNWMEQ